MAHFVRFCAHFRSHSMPIRGEARPVSMPPHRFLDSTLAGSNSVQMGRKWEPARRGMGLWADRIPDCGSFMRLAWEQGRSDSPGLCRSILIDGSMPSVLAGRICGLETNLETRNELELK